MRSAIDSILLEIKEDRTTGAVELVRKGVDAIVLFISNFSGTKNTFFEGLVRISRILVDSQPSSAPFFHLANIIYLALEDHQELEEMKQATMEGIKRFALHIQNSVGEISKITRGLIMEGSKVLTHSFSTTVLRTLVDLKKEGKEFEVICTEGRPMCEGYHLAKRLNENGIRVQLQIDSAAVYTMKDVHLVLVGADSLTPLGLVNKVGTYGLALSARERKIPFYALCGTDKLLGAGMAQKYRVLRRDPKEVWIDAPEGVGVYNFYFDTTPLEFLNAIITEEGVMRGSEILARFQKMRVSKYFPI